MRTRVFAAVMLLVLAAGRSQAASTITVDENGAGLPPTFVTDPVSGLSGLAYFLPGTVVPGDLLLNEPAPGQGGSDLLRFLNVTLPSGPQGGPTSVGVLLFFSDKEPNETPDLADVPGLPATNSASLIVASEVGPEGGPNGLTYTPTESQLGFITGGVTYNIISDVAVPLPAAVWGGLGLMGLAAASKARRCGLI